MSGLTSDEGFTLLFGVEGREKQPVEIVDPASGSSLRSRLALTGTSGEAVEPSGL